MKRSRAVFLMVLTVLLTLGTLGMAYVGIMNPWAFMDGIDRIHPFALFSGLGLFIGWGLLGGIIYTHASTESDSAQTTGASR